MADQTSFGAGRPLATTKAAKSKVPLGNHWRLAWNRGHRSRNRGQRRPQQWLACSPM